MNLKIQVSLFLPAFLVCGVAFSEMTSPPPTTTTTTISTSPSPTPTPAPDCDNPNTVSTTTDVCSASYSKTGAAPATTSPNSSINGIVTAVFCNVWCQRGTVTRPSSSSCTGGAIGSWGTCTPYPPELTSARLRVSCNDCDVRNPAGLARAQQLCDAIANPCGGVVVPPSNATLVCKKCL